MINMSAQELVLNIAVNLGRISRWALEGKPARIEQFLIETEEFIKQLEQTSIQTAFEETFTKFKTEFHLLKSNIKCDSAWAEDIGTWATILTHRAKLA